jgi:hypothetical protein
MLAITLNSMTVNLVADFLHHLLVTRAGAGKRLHRNEGHDEQSAMRQIAQSERVPIKQSSSALSSRPSRAPNPRVPKSQN